MDLPKIYKFSSLQLNKIKYVLDKTWRGNIFYNRVCETIISHFENQQVGIGYCL